VPRSRRGGRERPAVRRQEPTAAPGETPDDAAAGDAAAGDVAARSVAAASAAPPARPAPVLEAPEETGIASVVARLFIPAALLILLAAAALRLPELAINPFHHDEGVNGWFTTNLVREGTYVYDPANYHGPTLYYFALLSEILFGLTTEAMRLVPVIFGLVTVAAVFALRPVLGSVAVLTAGALLAVSPGSVYVSRYFIHEMLLVAFSLGFVVSALLYLRTGKPLFVLTAAASAALIFATKETGIITIVVLGIAAVLSGVYVNLRAGRSAFASTRPATRPGPRSKKPARSIWVDGVEYRAAEPAPSRADRTAADGPGWFTARGLSSDVLGAGAIVFLCVYVLFYSSFFTNFPKGLVDSLATFTIWTQTSGETQVQPIHQYLAWMLAADAPILVLGTIGGLLAAIRARDRVWVFIGLWAAGVTLAYSLVAYKTPWIIVNMLVPLALLGGLAIRELLGARGAVRLAAPVVLVAALGLGTYQAIDLNFRHYDDETYPYVFVHTTREALELIEEIEATGVRAGTGRDTGITITSPDYWPLPWYTRDYPKAGYFGSIVDTQEAMIVANVAQQAEVATKVGDRYRSVGTYTLRPGVELELWVRADIPGAAP
jgi:uncharacterized protein (TIGR03663 family)